MKTFALTFLVGQVVTKARMMVLQDELQEFLDEILPQLQTSGVQAPSGCLSEHLNVVASILLEAAQWAEHHLNEGNLHKVDVSFYMYIHRALLLLYHLH